MEFKRITRICRELRRNETPQEKVLWKALRDRNFFGAKFRRQHPFTYESIDGKKRFFVADFCSFQDKLVLELDGRVHDFQKDYDANRDKILASLGLTTIRITNDDLENNLPEVLNRIENQIKALSDQRIKTKQSNPGLPSRLGI
jgi:leucyl-tRNA synthetase